MAKRKNPYTSLQKNEGTPYKQTLYVRGSYDDMLRLANDPEAYGGTLIGAESRGTSDHKREWTRTESWEEAYDLAMNGWSDGVRRLSDLRDALLDDIGELLPEPVPIMDVTGAEVDVGEFAAGRPECMMDTIDLEGQSLRVRVMVNIATTAGTSPETMMMRGLLAAGVVDTLEHLGHSVDLDIVTFNAGSQDRSYGYAMVANVKRANEVLDIERVAFACAHPSMLRRVEFGVLESLNKTWRKRIGVAADGYGYGSPRDDWTNFLVHDDEKPDLYIGNAMQAENMNEVRQSIINYLQAAGALRE